MAKKKKQKARVPALSTADKVIYFFLSVASGAAGIFAFPLIIIALNRAFFRDPHVLAQANIGCYILTILGFCLGALLAAAFSELRRRKQPLFGRSDIKYGPPQWKSVYPFFSHKFWKSLFSDKKRLAISLTVFVLCGLVITTTTALMLPIRQCLLDNCTIVSYNCLNEQAEDYTASDFEKVRLYTREYFSRRGSSHWGFEMELTMHDNKIIIYSYNDFQTTDDDIHGAITGMLQIKSKVNPEIVVLEGAGTIPYVIRDMSLNQQEAALINSLFDRKN